MKTLDTSHVLNAFAAKTVRAVVLTAALLVSATHAHGQGCVVAHGSGLPTLPGLTGLTGVDEDAQPWDVSVSYRWFKSDRHYVGTTEQKQREVNADQVINHSNFTDFGLSYTVSRRYSVDLAVPYVSHDRSQVVKNASGVILDRFSTQASGLADISLVGNAWVFDPTPSTQGNVQLGLGLSLPTGQDDVNDVFETFDKTTGKIVAVRHAVDQSIQPGSGGYGIILSIYGYRELGLGFTGYVSGNYTVTPQEENGVHTARSNVYESIESVPDTYLARAGVEYRAPGMPGVSFSAGFRIEGVTVHDLIGGSHGFRRPGYSFDFEPGLSVARRRWSARLYVPIALQRNRLQSVPDQQTMAATGNYTHGDAAFADYEIMGSLSYRF